MSRATIPYGLPRLHCDPSASRITFAELRWLKRFLPDAATGGIHPELLSRDLDYEEDCQTLSRHFAEEGVHVTLREAQAFCTRPAKLPEVMPFAGG